MNEVIIGLNRLNEKYDRLKRRSGMDGEAVRIQFNSISNCLNDYRPCLEMVETDAKDHHRWICSFEETLANVHKFMDKVDHRLDTQEASIYSLDREREFGNGVSMQETEQQRELDQLREMAENTYPRTGVDKVFSRIKMALPADRIYSA